MHIWFPTTKFWGFCGEATLNWPDETVNNAANSMFLCNKRLTTCLSFFSQRCLEEVDKRESFCLIHLSFSSMCSTWMNILLFARLEFQFLVPSHIFLLRREVISKWRCKRSHKWQRRTWRSCELIGISRSPLYFFVFVEDLTTSLLQTLNRSNRSGFPSKQSPGIKTYF